MDKGKHMVQMAIRLPPMVARRLKVKAAMEGETIQTVLERAVAKYIDAEQEVAS